MSRWQHRIPVRTDDPRYHEEEPEPGSGHKKHCKHCNMLLIKVDENEGPEMLKALLRF